MKQTYLCLPAARLQTYTLVFQSPNINILPNNQTIQALPISSSSEHEHAKLAPYLLPLVTGLSLSVELGTRMAGRVCQPQLPFTYIKISAVLYNT